MARLQQSYSLKPLLLFSFFIVALSTTLSSARVLNDHNKRAATEPALNIAFPGDNIAGSSSENPWEEHSKHVLPCDMENSDHDEIVPARISGKYGNLFLNMLPKGSMPNSGPSTGYNSIND